MRLPSDIYDEYPDDMRRYLRHNGWTFNRKACEWAVGQMRRRTANGGTERITPYPKERVDEILHKYGVELQNNAGYDYVYVANMALADNYGSSLKDEQSLATYIKDTIDDVDAGDGEIMRCWYAKMVSRGMPVDWEEML